MANPEKNKNNIMDEEEYLQRKAVKLFHMAWSGVTKYIRSIVFDKKSPCEFPGLGIFLPLINFEKDILKETDIKRLTKQSLGKF